jgi:hypothetical protein
VERGESVLLSKSRRQTWFGVSRLLFPSVELANIPQGEYEYEFSEYEFSTAETSESTAASGYQGSAEPEIPSYAPAQDSANGRSSQAVSNTTVPDYITSDGFTAAFRNPDLNKGKARETGNLYLVSGLAAGQG